MYWEIAKLLLHTYWPCFLLLGIILLLALRNEYFWKMGRIPRPPEALWRRKQ